MLVVFPVIMLRRSWLSAAPLWLAAAGGLLWAAFEWSWWDWMRSLVIVFATAVVLVSIGTFFAGLVVLTRDGFWIPGQGRGRWSDVIDRDGYTLTMRVSELDGSPKEVLFDRVKQWPATGRHLDLLVPKDLPGLDSAQPHPEFVRRLDEWVDQLLAGLRQRCQPPDYARVWMLPSRDDGHRIVVRFAPTAAGSRVELCVTESEEFPEIKVDECFALEEMQEYEWEEDAYDSVDFADGRGLRRVIAVLAALFQDVPRTPIPSWQIVDADGETVQFYPDKLMK